MQVHHSFLHHHNSPANHVAQFVSRAGQFLCWNRAVFYCVQHTCTTRKNTGTRLTDTHASFFYNSTCTSFLDKFLERVSRHKVGLYWLSDVSVLWDHLSCVRECFSKFHPEKVRRHTISMDNLDDIENISDSEGDYPTTDDDDMEDEEDIMEPCGICSRVYSQLNTNSVTPTMA